MPAFAQLALAHATRTHTKTRGRVYRKHGRCHRGMERDSVSPEAVAAPEAAHRLSASCLSETARTSQESLFPTEGLVP